MTTLKATKAPKKPAALTADEVQAEREAIGVPDDGLQQRAWIRYQLQIKGWSQAKIARATYASESTVSVLYRGQRPTGLLADRVRRLTAEILGVREDVLFPEARDEAERRARERQMLHDARRERARTRKRNDRRAAKQRDQPYRDPDDGDAP